MIEKKKRAFKTAALTYEKQYTEDGCRNIVGFDEAGRGAWAGPVAAGAVCLPLENPELSTLLVGVRDSKQMTPRQRYGLEERIKETAVSWGVGSASAAEIDEMGINPATCLAMNRALEALMDRLPGFVPDCLLHDSMAWPNAPYHREKYSLKHGDQLSLSIAAASVLAKVWRDLHMRDLETAYPGYGFAGHKGYHSNLHTAALKSLG
ncbi:MAG: ribonuclease HII, partial [Chitinophagaceae bacterium]|nr:ribonuclease HII [Anaerolineae bacterium]